MALSDKALTTVASAKDYMGLLDDDSDYVIELLINSVSEDIEKRCRRTFRQTTQTEKVIGSSGHNLLLACYPVTAVSAVTIDGVAVALTEYEILAESGELFRIDNTWPSSEHRNITVAYTGGYVLPGQENKTATPPVVRNLPYDLETACIKMVAVDFQRRGSEHLQTEVLGPLRSDFLADYPRHVLDVLERYTRPVIA